MQFTTLSMPYKVNAGGGTFNVDLWKSMGFTSMNIWTGHTYDYQVANGGLPSGADALPFVKHVTDPSESVCSAEYLPNLIGVQLGDEQDFTPSAYAGWAAQVATLKEMYPNAIIYMNNDEQYYNYSLTTLSNFVQAVKPDMLSFTSYPFRWDDAPYHNYEGGSPTFFYAQVELYRKAGLAGLTGDGSQPIPVGMFTQTFAHVTSTATNHRFPTESEFRLQQFVGLASGMKWFDAFLYHNLNPDYSSMFFEGTHRSSQTPTAQFYQYQELIHESANLAPALVRLISTDFRMKMGSHGTGTGVTNTLPTGVAAMSTTADPYLKSVSATNLGTKNNGLAGDVVIGFFKPLDPSLVAEGSENDRYFMIVNGLSDGTGSAVDCRQLIHLIFDFGTSGIDSLLRLSRDTGLVEEVALTWDGGSLYSLDLTLDGGTGDLFKYNTGTAFIGTTSVPEPSTLFSWIACLVCGIMYYRAKNCFQGKQRL